MSCYLSSGCNNQRCSQSQKVSIGIVVDSVVKSRHDFIKDASNHNAQRTVKASTTVSKCANDVKEGSVRVTTASFGAKLKRKNSDHVVNHASRPATSNLYIKQLFPNHAMPEFDVVNKTEGDQVSGKVNKSVFMNDTTQKISAAPKQKVDCDGKVIEDRSKEALRMKLHELLGSGDKKFGNSDTPEVDVNEIRKETEKDEIDFKPRQNSDSIETDSENVDQMTKKPVTRNLTRRRATTARKRPRNLKSKSLTCGKEGLQGADVFSFAEKSAVSPPCAIKRVCSIVEKNDHKRSCGIKPRYKLSPVKDLRNIQPKINGVEKANAVEDSPLSCGGVKSPKNTRLDEGLEPDAAVQNLSFGHFPVAKEKVQSPSPTSQEKSEHLEPVGDQSPVHQVDNLNQCLVHNVEDLNKSPVHHVDTLKQSSVHNVDDLNQSPVHHVDVINSQRFKMKKTALDSPMGSYPLTNDKRGFQGSVQQEGGAGSKAKCYTPSTSSEKEISEYSDHADKLEDSPASTLKSSSEENDAVSADVDDDLMCYEESQDDGMARMVSLLGLALEKIKNKVISLTNKKCSEILVSAAVEIQLQLQGVESQIQTDLGKLTDIKTSKRKHLETRFQEQKDHLNAMHKKFKEDICQYLKDCKGAMEGMEEYHLELQGAIEKQKKLHKKLLLQTEATVEAQLSDAERQMKFVRKLGKQKMQQLQVVIAECLNG
ncbi:meiosis-specific protein ASY3 isoform X2 [Amaranthus tricolor]|uniref:meiosis-specific protein ASY3 isoform X2 n=1 Tax=Amaranthus tricolor TaxID=29722 RepID=UPI0025911003|nr:meiosis-specific protein ASY3 isoform X2 [Amaranthus tricolor]